MADAVLLIMGLLAVGFLSTRLAAALRVPHSVFLVLLGLASGVLLSWTGHSGSLSLDRTFPDVVFYLLLPPLVFESAYHMDYDALRRDLVPVTALSVVALLFSTLSIGWGLNALLHIDWTSSLVFGALISATDPVAVVAMFREVGAPRRLSILVEGESLLNDGTAIVLFRVLTAPQGPPGMLQATMQFVYVALGGVAVGWLAGWLAGVLLRWTSQSPAAQLGLTVAVAWLSFIAADHGCHVSGVIATMTAGLYLGRRARLDLHREALHGMHALWDFLALSANTLVFLLVGLAVDPSVLRTSLAYIPATLGVVYVARAASVLATLEPLNWLGWMRPVGLRYQAVLIWGGLRGGLALALALVLPDTMPHKPLFIALATAVVLSTLLINALSLGPTMKALRLDVLDPVEEAFYRNSLALVLDEVFHPLQEASRSGRLSGSLLEDVEQFTRHQLLDDHPLPSDCGEAFEIQQLLLDEQQFYNRRREADALSREGWQRLTRLVSDRLDLYRKLGMSGLLAYRFDLAMPAQRAFWHTERHQVQQLVLTLEVLLNLDFGLHQSLSLPAHCTHPDLLAGWMAQARQDLDQLYQSYPQAGVAVQSQFVANAVAATAQHSLAELFNTEVINAAVYAQAERRVVHLHQRLLADSRRLLHPTLPYLLSHVPLLKEVPPEALARLAAAARSRRWPAGTVVVRQGDEGDSFFLVLAGLLEMEGGPVDRVRFFPGSFFGEMSLLFGIRRSATIVTVLPSDLAELDRTTFEGLLSMFPTVSEAVRASAWARLAQMEEARPPGSSPGNG